MPGALISLNGCKNQPFSPWVPFTLGTFADLRAVWFEDSQSGWGAGGHFNVVGGLVGRTRNGGKTWRFTSNIVADDSGRGGLLISSLRFFGSDHGVLNTIGAGVYLAPDGGENWSRATVTSGSSALSDMMFLSDATGWAGGDEGVWKTTDRRNERQKIAPQGGKTCMGVRAVHVVNDQAGWLAVTNGRLFRSEGGGASQ